LLSEQSARSNEQGTYGSDRNWRELAHGQGRDEADVCGECRDNERFAQQIASLPGELLAS
jgi:hypothetical protein